MRSRRLFFWGLFLACACFLHFANLGSTSLWQDEAETAVLARNTLRHGVPKVWDGRNLVSQNLDADHDSRGLWNYSPWLGIYLAAGSFALFKEGTFTARLPFALISLLSLLLLHKVVRRWSADKRSADLTVWLTLASIPYLLHARQCRYYVLDVFFALYLFWAYQELLEARKRAGWHVILSSLGLFHSNFLVFFSVLGGVAAHFAVFVPRKGRVLRGNALALGSVLLLLLPACLYFKVFSRAGGENPHWLLQRWENLRDCLREVDSYIFPLLLVPVLLLAGKRLRSLQMPLSYLLGGLAFLVLAPHHFFRYLIHLIPICAFLTAEIFWTIHDRRREAAWAMLGGLLFTHLFSLSAWTGQSPFLKTDLADFIHETTHPIREPVGAAVEYLNRNASPGDLLLVTYPDLPFIFYTPLRVVGGRSGPRRISPRESRWVLVRDQAEKASWPLDFKDYDRVPLDSPNRPWGNRPDPDLHVFRTAATPEPAVLYRRNQS